MARSWYATYRAVEGTLIGGVKSSKTSRWGSKELAEVSLANVITINASVGVKCEGEVIGSEKPPEIFVHCGTMAQAVGGNCFHCGKKLTWDDASEHASKDNEAIILE